MFIANENRYSKMEYNYCGKSGLALPKISLGLWQNFGDKNSFDEMKDIVYTAFDMGITHFDLANNYGPPAGQAEINFGKILKDGLMPYRDELVISTKAGYDMWDGPYGSGGSRKHMMSSLDQSLSRMGLDYVDIFYHHRMTPETPLIETAITLADVVRQGKSIYVGLSNYNGHMMRHMHNKCKDLDVPFIVNQNRYSILERTVDNDGIGKESHDHHKGIVAFSPLAQGRLSDKYINGIPKSDARLSNTTEEYRKHIGLDDVQLEKIHKLGVLANERGETLSQMAIQWVLQRGVTTVLIGARTKQQLLENLEALEKPPLTKQELKLIDKITKKNA